MPSRSETNQFVKLSAPVEAKAIKVVNNKDKKIWWRVAELHATCGMSAATQAISTNMPVYSTNSIDRAIDGNDSTQFWSSRATAVNDWVMLNFGERRFIDSVRMLQGTKDCFTSSKLYYTTDEQPKQGGNWTEDRHARQRGRPDSHLQPR